MIDENLLNELVNALVEKNAILESLIDRMFGSKYFKFYSHFVQFELVNNYAINNLKFVMKIDLRYEIPMVTRNIIACRLRVEQANLLRNEQNVEIHIPTVGSRKDTRVQIGEILKNVAEHLITKTRFLVISIMKIDKTILLVSNPEFNWSWYQFLYVKEQPQYYHDCWNKSHRH